MWFTPCTIFFLIETLKAVVNVASFFGGIRIQISFLRSYWTLYSIKRKTDKRKKNVSRSSTFKSFFFLVESNKENETPKNWIFSKVYLVSLKHIDLVLLLYLQVFFFLVSCYYSKVTRFIMADIFFSFPLPILYSKYKKNRVQGHHIKLANPVNTADETISGM